jgi:hypothetical protein
MECEITSGSRQADIAGVDVRAGPSGPEEEDAMKENLSREKSDR